MEKADFFTNTQGLNLTDSPFFVKDGQATGGFNYDYVKTGGISKIRGLTKVNSLANPQTNTQGIAIHDDVSNTKTILLAAGTKLQTLDITSQLITNIANDTVSANTDFFSNSSTQPVVSSGFNSSLRGITWMVGAGAALPVGYTTYNTDGEYTWVTSGAGSGLFVSGNTVSFSINGRAYSVPFDSDNITTLNAVATAMRADTDVGSVLITDNLHTIAITGKNGHAVTISGSVVTGGSTQPTITVTTVIAPQTGLAKVTTNGVTAPTGTFTAVNQGSGAGSGWTTGTYWYGISYRKRSTQALSNVALDQSVTVSTSTDSVLLTRPTGVDTTLYDRWFVYRSSVGGVKSFTAGSLVAEVDINSTTFTDTNLTLASSQLVPRNGNTLLDNSPLPSGTYNTIATYKRHLVTASGTTLRFADLDKSESWPAGATIDIPSGGSITGLQTIGYNSPNTGTTDEYLLVFKQRELWVITGTGIYDATTGLYDYSLKYVDAVGCISQALSTKCNGFVCWLDYRGIYMWDGLNKPVYCSRPIEALFGQDGDLDKVNLNLGFANFFREKNQVVWTVSHRTLGINKLQIKLDVRLTVPQLSQNFSGNNILEGVFSLDAPSTALYAGATYLPNSGEELFLVGDHSGFIYKAYYGTSNDGSGINFSYMTKAHDLGLPVTAKQFSKVVVYIDQSVAKNLELTYWSDYSTLMQRETVIDRSMDTGIKVAASLWDLAIWDQSQWDEYNPQLVPLVYNLNAVNNNNQGDSIRLMFSQNDADAPVTIYGYSIFWDAVGIRK